MTALLHKLTLGEHGPGGLFKYRLPLEALDTHVYVVGRTRKGKSKFLEHLAHQLIALGQGCAVLDPHSDLADDLLAHLAPMLEGDLARRMVYFDPSRADYLPPFNVLDAPWDTYATAQSVLEAFRRTWPQSLREAPRSSNIILAATMALIENRMTLTEMPRLLTDASYRNALLERVEDPEVIRFFRTRYERWGRDQATIAEAVLNKVGALSLNPILRLILGQRENGLSFREIMDQRKVLMVDLGRVDAETRRLLGSLIVTGLEQAALSRKELPQGARAPFYLVMDEFQDYCVHEGSEQTLSHLLSECRKFGLHMIMAHQNRQQLSPALHGALENAQMRVVFGVGRGTARAMVEEMFQPELPEEGSEGKRTPSLEEQWERFSQRAQGLGQRDILVQLPEQSGVRHLRTRRVREAGMSAEELEALKRRLARLSGKKVSVMKRTLERRDRIGQMQAYERVKGGRHG